MKTLVASLALAAAIALGLDALGDLTQNRPDRDVPGSTSELLLRVSTRSGEPPATAARRLWMACEHTVRNRLLDPGLVEVGDGLMGAVTEPAVGPRSWRRLKGCLEDLTLDHVQATVISKVDRPPAS